MIRRMGRPVISLDVLQEHLLLFLKESCIPLCWQRPNIQKAVSGIGNGKCQGQHTLEEKVLEGRADPNPASPRPGMSRYTGRDCKDSFAIRSVFKA